jgi:hypothetical protein
VTGCAAAALVSVPPPIDPAAASIWYVSPAPHPTQCGGRLLVASGNEQHTSI